MKMRLVPGGRHGAQHAIAVALVESRRLEADRIQDRADAAALPSLILR